jgi:ADP-heptose:LPS heptosyltransferase
VVYFARLGDMVMLTALLNYLHRRFHLPCQVVTAGNWASGVFEGNPDVAQLWSFDRHFPFMLTSQWPKLARALRVSAPGPIYICEHHRKQLPRVRRMLSFSGIDPNRCVFMTEQPGTVHHSVDRLVNLGQQTPAALDLAQYPLPNIEPAPRLRVFNNDRVELDAWLRSKGWAGRPIIMIQPGNHRSMSRKRDRWRRLNTDDKFWPFDRWVELLRRIHARMPNALLMLRGSHEEVKMLQELQMATGLDAVVAAGVDLRPLFALCEMSHSMISVDTGPAHAAAALGLPLVVMYGAAHQKFWLPRSHSGSPVVGVGGPPQTTRVDQIAVDEVYDAWCSVISKIESTPRRQPANAPTLTFPQTSLRDGARALQQ